MRFIGRLLRSSLAMWAALIVFVAATGWLFPMDAEGTLMAPDAYVLIAFGCSVWAFVRQWRKGKTSGKVPFSWKRMWKAVGVFFGTAMVHAIALEVMYGDGAAAPYWVDGLLTGLPTIVTICYVCLDKRKTVKPEVNAAEPHPVEAPAQPRRQTVTTDPKAMYLHQLRKQDDAIEDEAVSAQIRQMEGTLERIFDWTRTHPQSEGELKQLMDYYLPMTVKLLGAYADMDAAAVEGENIYTAKAEIGETLTALNRAYEKLLEDLVADTVLDVSTDISVLKSLLAREGLAEDELTRMRRELNGQ